MNCQQAKEQIDERAIGTVQGERASDAALDAHVASCAVCRDYARAVAATDKLLAGVRADRPSNEEMADMWNTLALSLPGQGVVTVKAARKPRPWLRVAVYSASIAAVLLVAAQLGSLQYGGEVWIPGLPQLARSRGYIAQSMRYEAQRSDTQFSGTLAPVNSGVVRSPEMAANASGEDARIRYRRGSAPGGGLAGGVRPTDAELDASAVAAKSVAPQVAAAPPPPSMPVAPTVSADAYANPNLPSAVPGSFAGHIEAREKSQSQSSEPGVLYGTSRKNFQTSEGSTKTDEKTVDAGARPGRRARGGGPHGELRPANWSSTDPGIAYAVEQVSPSSEELKEVRSDAGLFNRAITFELYNDAVQASGGGGAAGQAGSEGGQESNIPSSAKIIRTGLLNIEVPIYANVATQVEQMVAAHRGFIGDSNVVEQTGGAIVGTVVIRVPAEQFEGLFAALKGLGRVVSEHSDSDDVTAAYVDLEARIVSQRVTEERLHDLVRNKTIVDKVSALLEVERELQRVRSDIERMQGELRVMADRVALSTITLTLSEPKRIVPTASLSVEVGTVDEAGASLGSTLTTLNGRLLSGKTNKRSDGTLMATYQLQVPLSRFNELLDAVTVMGRIEERQVSDHEFSAVKEPWATNVQCSVALTVFERSRQQPSGTMFVEADNLEVAARQLEGVLEPTAARIVSSYSVVDPQGASKAEVTLSVPAASFSELVARLGQLGRVQSQSITGETKNASGGAASVLCSIRLTITEVVREVPTGQIIVEVEKFDAARTAVVTLVGEKSLQVLDSSSQQNMDGSWRANFELGVEAKDMEEVVGRLEGLGRVASRNMQGIGLGSLSRTDPKALGHLSVSIAEKSAIAPAPEQAGQTLRTHLRDGLEGLYKSAGLIAYGLIVMGPWLAIAILVGWLIGRVRGRRTSAKP